MAEVRLDEDGLLLHPLLSASPRLCVWRAPTENDRIGGMAAAWQAAGLDDPRRELVAITRDGTAVTVESLLHVGSNVIGHRQVMTPMPGGDLHLTEEASVPDGLDDLPRVGTTFEVTPGFDSVTWFGRGPHENYPDRRRGARVGTWRTSVSEMYTPYIRPQEAGGRADVRWLSLAHADGRVVTLRMASPRQMSATHHRAAALAAATHHEELVPAAETIVHIDAAHRGLGTASCGPDTLGDYRFGPGTYRWEWIPRPTRLLDAAVRRVSERGAP